MADKIYFYVESTKRNKAKAKRLAKKAGVSLKYWWNKVMVDMPENKK